MTQAERAQTGKGPAEDLASEALKALRDIRHMLRASRKGLQDRTAVPRPRLPQRKDEIVSNDEAWPLWHWVGNMDRQLQALGRGAAECGADVPRDWYEGRGCYHGADGLSRRLVPRWRFMAQGKAIELILPVIEDLLVKAGEAIRKAEERVQRAGCLKAARAGRIGGATPYGYKRTPDHQLAVDFDRAAVVRRIFTDYVGGKSFTDLARALNQEKAPTARGGDWHDSSIHDILSNAVYVGRLTFNRLGFRRDRRTGRRRAHVKPESEVIRVERPDLAIVPADLFAAAQARRARRPARGSEVRRAYSLSGVVECAERGSAYVAQKSNNSKGRYVYMQCGGRNSGGPCDNAFRFRLDIVQVELMRRLADVLFTPETEQALKATITKLAMQRLATKDAELARLDEMRASTERKVEKIMALMLEAAERGDRTDELWARELAKHKASLDALTEREAELTVGPRLDLAHLERVVEQAMRDQKAGLLDVKEPSESARRCGFWWARSRRTPTAGSPTQLAPPGCWKPGTGPCSHRW